MPVSLTDITNFLCMAKKKDGEYISYGALRMHKATVVNTVKLTGDLVPATEAEEAQLKALIDSVKRTQPDQAKYGDTFDLDDLLVYLVEDNDLISHNTTRNHFH